MLLICPKRGQEIITVINESRTNKETYISTGIIKNISPEYE